LRRCRALLCFLARLPLREHVWCCQRKCMLHVLPMLVDSSALVDAAHDAHALSSPAALDEAVHAASATAAAAAGAVPDSGDACRLDLPAEWRALRMLAESQLAVVLARRCVAELNHCLV